MNKLSILFLTFLSYGITANAMSKAQKRAAKQQRITSAIAREQAAIARMNAARTYVHGSHCQPGVNCDGSCRLFDARNQNQPNNDKR